MLTLKVTEDIIVAEVNYLFYEYEIANIWSNYITSVSLKDILIPLSYGDDKKGAIVQNDYKALLGIMHHNKAWGAKYSSNLFNDYAVFRAHFMTYLEMVGILCFKKMLINYSLDECSTVGIHELIKVYWGKDTIYFSFNIVKAEELLHDDFILEDLVLFMRFWLMSITEDISMFIDFIEGVIDFSESYAIARASSIFNLSLITDSALEKYNMVDYFDDDDVGDFGEEEGVVATLVTKDKIYKKFCELSAESDFNYFPNIHSSFWSDTQERFIPDENIPVFNFLAQKQALDWVTTKTKYANGVILSDMEIDKYFPNGGYNPISTSGYFIVLEPLVRFDNKPDYLKSKLVFISRDVMEKSKIWGTKNINKDAVSKSSEINTDEFVKKIYMDKELKNIVLRCSLDDIILLCEYVVSYSKGSKVYKDLEGNYMFAIPYAELKLNLSEILDSDKIEMADISVIVDGLEVYIEDDAIGKFCIVARNKTAKLLD